MVYYHFGREIISTLQQADLKDPLVEKLFVKVSPILYYTKVIYILKTDLKKKSLGMIAAVGKNENLVRKEEIVLKRG